MIGEGTALDGNSGRKAESHRPEPIGTTDQWTTKRSAVSSFVFSRWPDAAAHPDLLPDLQPKRRI